MRSSAVAGRESPHGHDAADTGTLELPPMVESDDRASDPKTARETARWLKIMFRFADDSMMVLLFAAPFSVTLVSMGKMKEVTMDTALLVRFHFRLLKQRWPSGR